MSAHPFSGESLSNSKLLLEHAGGTVFTPQGPSDKPGGRHHVGYEHSLTPQSMTLRGKALRHLRRIPRYIETIPALGLSALVLRDRGKNRSS